MLLGLGKLRTSCTVLASWCFLHGLDKLVLVGLYKLCASWSLQVGACWSWLDATWSLKVGCFLVLASCVLLGLSKLVLLGLGKLCASWS